MGGRDVFVGERVFSGEWVFIVVWVFIGEWVFVRGGCLWVERRSVYGEERDVCLSKVVCLWVVVWEEESVCVRGGLSVGVCGREEWEEEECLSQVVGGEEVCLWERERERREVFVRGREVFVGGL